MLRRTTSKVYHTASQRLFVRTSSRSGCCFAIGNVVTSNRQTTLSSLSSFSTKSSPSESKDAAAAASSKCPIRKGQRALSDIAARMDSSTDTSTQEQKQEVGTSSEHPKLRVVPSFPIVGSFFFIIPGIGPFLQKHYKVPEMNPKKVYDFYSSLHEQYGDFYAIDIPGMGLVHCVNDPEEMLKVVRNEGAYPRGGVSNLEPFIKWGKKRNLKLTAGEDNGFFGQGESWRTIRTFLQTDLLSPQAARGYVPAIVEAAQLASQGADHYEDDLNTFMNYCAFDLFQTVMFGEMTKVSDPHTPTDPVNQEFVENSVESLALMIFQIFDKTEVIKGKMGIVTPTYQKFEAAMDRVNEIANEKIVAFREKWQRGDLNEAEKASYIALAFERQEQEKSGVSLEEMTELTMLALNAGVDTTSTFISWAMVHLSMNPDVQERLYQELKENVQENDGKLSSALLTKNQSPYLHAVLRESHRLTPVHPTTMLKSNSNNEIDIHGVTLPKGSLFQFDSYSMGINPEIVKDPHDFRPDRWSADAIQSRKGKPSQILDHVFYRDPFSQGARRCPGSRVAVNETLVLLSQLVLDWKFEPKDASIESYQDVEYEQKTLLVPVLPPMKLTARN